MPALLFAFVLPTVAPGAYCTPTPAPPRSGVQYSIAPVAKFQFRPPMRSAEPLQFWPIGSKSHTELEIDRFLPNCNLPQVSLLMPTNARRLQNVLSFDCPLFAPNPVSRVANPTLPPGSACSAARVS